MSEDFFAKPENNDVQASYDRVIQSVNLKLKTIVQAALDFDHQDEPRGYCFQRARDQSEGTIAFDRNLSTATQQIFGLRFLAANVNQDADTTLRIKLGRSLKIGPNIVSEALSNNQANSIFWYPVNTYLRDGETAHDDIYDRLSDVEILLFDEPLERLQKIEAAATKAANEVLQLSTMCKLTDDLTPYYDLLKSWSDERTA